MYKNDDDIPTYIVSSVLEKPDVHIKKVNVQALTLADTCGIQLLVIIEFQQF